MVRVNVGTSDFGKCSSEFLEAKFRWLNKMLKFRTFKVAFSELLTVPYAGPTRGNSRVSESVCLSVFIFIERPFRP